jgi:hypothetical protein
MWPFKKSKPADRPPGALWGVPEEEYEKWPSEEEIAKMPRDQQFINRWTKEDVQTFPPVLEPDSSRILSWNTEFAPLEETFRAEMLPEIPEPLTEDEESSGTNIWSRYIHIYFFSLFMAPFYGIFPAIRVAFRTRGFGLLGLLAFRKPPGFERRTSKIMLKIVKRHSRKMFRRVLVYGAFLPFWLHWMIPLHKYLPTQRLPPLIENAAHAAWAGAVPGIYFGYMVRKPFLLTVLGSCAGIFLGASHSTDGFIWYRRRLLEMKSKISGVPFSELEKKYPLIQNSAHPGYYADRITTTPINPDDAEFPSLRASKQKKTEIPQGKLDPVFLQPYVPRTKKPEKIEEDEFENIE